MLSREVNVQNNGLACGSELDRSEVGDEEDDLGKLF